MRLIWLITLTTAAASGSGGYSRLITTDHTHVGTSDSSNFPVLVYASDSTLKDMEHGGHVRSAMGADIVFFGDAGLTTQLPSEIELYDNINGVLRAWVQLPALHHSSNDTFYVEYGNSSPPARTTHPWDSSFVGVWHLASGTTLSVADSTGLNTTTNVNGATAGPGQIDGAATFVASSNQYLSAGTIAGLTGAAKATLSGWMYRSASNRMVSFGAYATNAHFSIDADPAGNVYNEVDHLGGNYPYYPFTGTGWHFFALTFDGTQPTANRVKAYLDGMAQTLTAGGMGNPTTLTNSEFRIGDKDTGYSTGSIDEVRVSTTPRSPDWITAEYNNQYSPGNIGAPGFLTWGTETPLAATPGVVAPLRPIWIED